MNQQEADKILCDRVALMSLAEKIDLLGGHGMWKTKAVARLGIPEIVMTDGTYGVRYSIEQIDNDAPGGQDLEAFLGVVNRRANEVQAAWGQMRPATCFANGSSLASSWDVALAYELGAALARECQALGVHLLLGPGINLRRTPLAGRSYEYYSEDPVLTGDFAAAVINGLQDGGVGASLKHFACNNSEVERTTMDSIVTERALREVYLLGFERAIRKSKPWTVMSSYNKLNGCQAAENGWLLTTVLREAWGYDGVVISDWHGIKDRPAALLAGNDLDMPESQTRKEQLLTALALGSVSVAAVDAACTRVLGLISRAKAGERRDQPCDFDGHHNLARRMAGESIVLLKNDGVLPLDPARLRRILVVGAGAIEPVIQGSGCATTTPTRVDVPLNEIKALAGPDSVVDYCPGYGDDPAQFDALRAEALGRAVGAAVVIVFAHTAVGYDGEGSDRRDLNLAPGHDLLIGALAAQHANVVVVLANPDAVVMPWLDAVAAVVETFFAGQAMGGAVADILFGKVNPSGKLTVTFPVKLEDIPGYLTYPGENGRHLYSEDVYVGYRYYDRRGVDPLFPFGFGLSYTTFAYSDLHLSAAIVGSGDTLTVSFSVTNVGGRQGKEICQVYLQPTAPRLHRPLRALAGFAKIELAPGETGRVSVVLESRDFMVFDPAYGRWLLDRDQVTVAVGASSRDIRLAATVRCDGEAALYRKLARDTQPVFVLENPLARRAFVGFLQTNVGISAPEAERILEGCRSSFFGIFVTMDRRFRLTFPETAIQELLDQVNAAGQVHPA
ncbi:MAG: glycoside hydrolase family 3 C-terminal domain-containing protein [Azospirillaceae bacterium]|nr:glycoside hydrolase family 3 C-terminal domain-containing protein [Azospirillaceae bacterium]